jgi:hypothetical protein
MNNNVEVISPIATAIECSDEKTHCVKISLNLHGTHCICVVCPLHDWGQIEENIDNFDILAIPQNVVVTFHLDNVGAEGTSCSSVKNSHYLASVTGRGHATITVKYPAGIHRTLRDGNAKVVITKSPGQTELPDWIFWLSPW